MKKTNFIILILLLIFLNGCDSSNEDPTNIELEVLRATLLEKELMIDELRDTIDTHVKEEINYKVTITDLNLQLDNETKLKEKLLEGQDQILVIQENKNHYFDFVQNQLYIIISHQDTEFDYSYEELFRYENGEKGELIYKGDNIQFYIDDELKTIHILDNYHYLIIDYDLTILYDISLDQGLHKDKDSTLLYKMGSSSYILFEGATDTGLNKLYAIYSVQYNAQDDIVILSDLSQYDDYVFDTMNGWIYYTIIDENQYKILMGKNLTTSMEIILDNNQVSDFKPYIEEKMLIYYKESMGDFMSVELLMK